MEKLRRSEKGFTLIELLVVMAIISVLAAVFVIPNLAGHVERSRVNAANATIENLEKSIDYFYIDNEELPSRKDNDEENYYTLLYTGQASDGAALTAVKMANKQGADQSQSGVLDLTDFPLIKRDNLYNHMIVNGRSYPTFTEHKKKGSAYGWRESYLKLVSDMLDPWGNSYVIALKDLGNSTTRIFIVSAGPDKILDTDPATAVIVNADDLGITWIMRP